MSRSDARRGGTLRFAAKLALVVIIIAVAVYLVVLSDLQRARRWRLDRLHAAGIPTDWSEIPPPPIPDEDNAALIYEQAFNRLNFAYSTRGLHDRECLSNFIYDRPPGTRATLYPRIKQILARNQAALALLEQAAARPRCRFPLQWDQGPCEMLLRHLSYLRRCSQLLVADALVAARQGDAARVTQAYRTAIRLSRHAASEPLYVSFLSAISIEATLSKHLPELLEDIDLDPAACRMLIRELDGLDFDASCRRAMISQGCETLWYFNEAERRPGDLRGILAADFSARYTGDSPGPVLHGGTALYLSPLGKLVRLKEEIVFLDTFDNMIALTAKPYRATASQWADLERRTAESPFYYFITHVVMPLGRMAMVRDRAIAYRNGMQVILALKAYHTAHGEYPATLNALAIYPGGARKSPDDPFSGKPFGYRRQGAGFLLYSWGMDLDDDGGRPIPQQVRSYPPDGDIVWTFGK